MDRSSISSDEGVEGGAPPAYVHAVSPQQFGQAAEAGPTTAIGMKWSALHDAASIVARIAAVETPVTSDRVRHFPARIRDTGGWRRHLAEQGIDDLTAILEPGLAALLAVHARGADPQPAALALWQEFVFARNAVLDLAPPAETAPLRST
ncbi:MAG TPA: hypothetical protein VJM34_09020 [Novosphingobium sp.]|nr:hypothetical protein [Novosphingobium sp.]